MSQIWMSQIWMSHVTASISAMSAMSWLIRIGILRMLMRWRDSFVCDVMRIHSYLTCDENSFVCDMMRWFIRMRRDEMIHSYMTYDEDSFVCDMMTWCIRMWRDKDDEDHSHTNDSFVRDTNHSYEWYDSSISTHCEYDCVTWLIHIWHDPFM